jgi:hypothetical protein
MNGEPTPPAASKRRRLSRRAKILLGAAALVVLGGGAAVGYVSHYVKTDPAFCTSCHASPAAWTEWQRSSHARINCHTCHEARLTANLETFWDRLTGAKDVGRHGGIDPESCEKCHAQRPSWPKLMASGGHRIHFAKAKIPCVRCHAQMEHVKRPPESVCAECHRSVVVGLDKMATTHCLSCHEYLATSEGLMPRREQCLRCHAQAGSPADFEAGTHNQMDCAPCHQPHEKRKPGDSAVLRINCERCHKKPVQETAKIVAVAAKAPPSPTPRPGVPAPASRSFADAHGRCGSCHTPHGKKGEAATRCLPCHAEKRPHRRTAGHADCVSCHRPHEWKSLPSASACRSCHGAEVAGTRDVTPAHRTCKTCHTPHLEATARSRCRDCHPQVVVAVAKEARVHGECAVCHKPHEAAKQGERACADCHGDRVHGRPGVHDRCSQCHAPHALSERKAPLACAKCHAPQVTRVRASPAPHGTCSTCHPAHRDPKKSVKPCTDCHRTQAQIAGGVHPRCNPCHEPHAVGPARARAACASCHRAAVKLVRTTTGAHAECKSCHPTHSPRPKPARAALACQSCHRKVARRAQARGGEHADCKNCHASHGRPGRGEESCGKCHRKVHRAVTTVASPPPHRRCASCHPQHQLKPSGPSACRSCHAREHVAASSFIDRHPGAAAAHGPCRTCHDAHGSPKVRKGCESCHAGAAKSALHSLPGHARCGDCHAAHDPGVQGRDKCLSCHAKQRDHMPAATDCKSCHLFR